MTARDFLRDTSLAAFQGFLWGALIAALIFIGICALGVLWTLAA